MGYIRYISRKLRINGRYLQPVLIGLPEHIRGFPQANVLTAVPPSFAFGH